MTTNEYQSARADWLGILARLWEAYGKQIEPSRLAIYEAAFSAVPMGILERGVNRAIRDNQYNMVPTVAQVWAAIRKELGNPMDLDAAMQNYLEASWARVCVRIEGVPA